MAAGQLKSRRRWLPALLLLAAVLLAHLWLGEAVWQMQSDWHAVEPMPPKLRVSFVREMKASRPAVHRPSQVVTAATVRRLGSVPAMPDGLAAAVIAPPLPASEPLLDALPAQPPAIATQQLIARAQAGRLR